MGAMNGHEQANNVGPEVPFVIPPPDDRHPIRYPRPWGQRRAHYNHFQKKRAVRLLNQKVPCREIARLIGPRCSAANPIRWRREALRDAAFLRHIREVNPNMHLRFT